jgi:membrane-associated HD superfamily phosphohydrolase
MRFNPEETKNRIEQSRQGANPVMAIMKKGQILIREGDSITSDSLDQIEVLNRYTGRVHFNYVLGILLLQITFLVVIFVLMHGFLGTLVPDGNAPILSAMLLVFYFLYSFFVLRAGHFDEQRLIFSLYLPLPFVVMTVTILYNIQVAMLVSLCAVFFSTALMGGDFNSS